MRCSMVGKSKYIDNADDCHRAPNYNWSHSDCASHAVFFETASSYQNVSARACSQQQHFHGELDSTIEFFRLTSTNRSIVTCSNKSAMLLFLFCVCARSRIKSKWNEYAVFE